MATFSYTNLFSAGTPAVASQVNTNFNDVKTFVQGISTGTNIDGSAISEAKIAAGAVSETKLATGAVTETKIGANAVTVGKLSAGVVASIAPIGAIVQYAGTAEPTGWKFCNGQTLAQATYTDLYNLLTTTGTVFRYGANPSVGNFLLPDLRHRVPVGLGSETEFDVLGETGGVKSVTLTAAQSGLPSHSHTYGLDSNGSTSGIGVASTFDSTAEYPTNTLTAGPTNASEAHTNLQPYIVMNYLIRVV